MSKNIEVKLEKLKKPFERYAKDIFVVRSEKLRSERTRELIEKELLPGVKADDLINRACEEAKRMNPELDIKSPKEGASIAMATLMLQYNFLGLPNFPRTDDPEGCDGLLGIKTLTHLRNRLHALDGYLKGKEKQKIITSSKIATLKGSTTVGPQQQLDVSEVSNSNTNGALPFNVQTNGYLDSEQYAFYKQESRKAYRRYKMPISERLDDMQREYKFKEALKVSINFLNLPKKYWKVFIAFLDATARTESGYNPVCLPGTGYAKGSEGEKGLRKVRAPERGMFQLFTQFYKGPGGTRNDIERRKRIPGVNYDALSGMNFPDVNAERLSLMQQTIVFINQYAAHWREYRNDMNMEDIFEQIINTNDESMIDQWAAMLYLRHRNGVGGSKIFRDLLKRGIKFPTNQQEVEVYFEKYLEGKTWQGKRFGGNRARALSDFKMVVRQTMGGPKQDRFLQQFKKNLREMENVDMNALLNAS